MALYPNPPTPTSNALSGGVWVSGPGNTQTSASTGTQYAEFNQWLTINYTRNPVNGHYINPETHRGLDQLSSVNVINITDTELHFIITAHTSCKKILADYTTSAYYQPQKFQIQSNKLDKVGLSYGEVDGSANMYVFGPQGSIVTSQPYIKREPWDATIHNTYAISNVGSTHGYMLSNFFGQVGAIWAKTNISHRYNEYLLDNDIYPEPFPHEKKVAYLADTFPITGGSYNTSAEIGFGNNINGLAYLIKFIEDNCNVLNAPFWGHRYSVLLPLVSSGYLWVMEGDRLPPNPYYKTAVHDYS